MVLTEALSEDLRQRAAHPAAPNVLQRVNGGVVQRRNVPTAPGWGGEHRTKTFDGLVCLALLNIPTLYNTLPLAR